MAQPTAEEVRTELRAWLDDAWDPDLTVAEWWARLADGRWTVPTWPEEWHGRGFGGDLARVVSDTLRDAGALGPPAGLGVLLAGPTIYTHGTDEQKQRYLRPIVDGQEGWCQLFSEPGAGSDLASLQTKAVRDGDEWVITGRRCGRRADRPRISGMLIARTDVDAPEAQGHHVLRVPDGPARRRGAATPRDDRARAVQRGLLRRARASRRRDHRRARQRLEGREHDAGVRARRPRWWRERRRRRWVPGEEGQAARRARR